MEVIVNNNKYDVKCVLTQKDISNGMMDKKFDNNFDGMFFIMDDGEHNFWMKNCITPLDIIFINDNVITKIFENCEPCRSEECKRYTANGNYVLEIPAGDCSKYKIKEGDTVNFTL
jgi:uncharacterized membrane protein (UPF0127 family)